VKTLLLVALVLLVPIAGAIYGGAPAEQGAYPWMAHLYIDEPQEGIVCGGFLVAPRVVVTAAHCIPHEIDALLGPNWITGGESIDDYRVMFGQVDVRGDAGDVYRVVAAQRHPEARLLMPHLGGLGYAANDIGVLQLDRPAPYPTLRLATDADRELYPSGAVARVIGWGCTENVCFPNHLQQVDVPVFSDAECAVAPNYVVMYHPDTELCAGDRGIDSCGGDSGGPLFVRDAQGPVAIGIVNYGAYFSVEEDPAEVMLVPCGSRQHPGVYAEVAAFEAFLAPWLE